MRFPCGLLAACLLSILPVDAVPIPVGALSFTEFIPGDVSLPGVNAFDILNLTGAFALPLANSFGNSSVFHNNLRNPPVFSENLGIVKRTVIKERINAELKIKE